MSSINDHSDQQKGPQTYPMSSSEPLVIGSEPSSSSLNNDTTSNSQQQASSSTNNSDTLSQKDLEDAYKDIPISSRTGTVDNPKGQYDPVIPEILPHEQVYSIQVGEQLFKLSGASLSSDAPSYFTTFFLKRETLPSSERPTLYIDRSSKLFGLIVAHLQGYYVMPDNDVDFVYLFLDANYYHLPRLIRQLATSEIYIRIGSMPFRIPRNIFNGPGDSPNFFTLGFSAFFGSELGPPSKSFKRPPPLAPPSVPHRSSALFADLLKVLQGSVLEIKDEEHRALLLADCRYYRFLGLEQKLIAHRIGTNRIRQTEEIIIGINDIKVKNLTFKEIPFVLLPKSQQNKTNNSNFPPEDVTVATTSQYGGINNITNSNNASNSASVSPVPSSAVLSPNGGGNSTPSSSSSSPVPAFIPLDKQTLHSVYYRRPYVDKKDRELIIQLKDSDYCSTEPVALYRTTEGKWEAMFYDRAAIKMKSIFETLLKTVNKQIIDTYTSSNNNNNTNTASNNNNNNNNNKIVSSLLPSTNTTTPEQKRTMMPQLVSIAKGTKGRYEVCADDAHLLLNGKVLEPNLCPLIIQQKQQQQQPQNNDEDNNGPSRKRQKTDSGSNNSTTIASSPSSSSPGNNNSNNNFGVIQMVLKKSQWRIFLHGNKAMLELLKGEGHCGQRYFNISRTFI